MTFPVNRMEPMGAAGKLFFGLVMLLLLPQVSQGQTAAEDLFKSLQRENAAGSLAILSLVGIPDDSASTIFLQSGQSSRSYDFRSAQFGGGFRVAEGFPLYLEGYAGYARYDPVLVFQQGGETSRLPLKWTSFAATGGIGWEFDIREHWKFRPLAHISVGRTQSDASIGAQAIANRLGLDREFLESGGIWAGGLGGSATLAYDRMRESGHQLEASLRYTHIEYKPIGDDEDLLVTSTAANTVLWSRYRWPLRAQAFGKPMRGVTDLSLSYLIGDQAKVLGTDWLARVGVGMEVDVSETKLPWVTSARLMVRYYGSDTVDGFSAGIGISF
ncbi:MAG: autotransporter outer membrane beta-barrel domain-containing protein [Paracoccaceae bacterium]